MALSYQYIDNKHKDTIGLIHGFGFTPEIWNHLLPALTERHNVIIPNINEMNTVKHEFTLKDIAASLFSIQNDLAIKSILWFGHSMGGYILTEMMALYPDRLKGASLIHAHVFGDSLDKKAARAKQISFVKEYGTYKFFRQMLGSLFFQEADRVLYLDTYLKATQKIDVNFVIEAMAAMKNRPNHLNSLSFSHLPMQIILGDKDPLLEVDVALKMISIPSLCNITILKNCAHVSMLEKKEELIESMLEFCDYCFNF